MNVDKVFIINLERRTDRKQQTSKELERVGIKNYEFFPAIEPKNLTVIEKWNPNFLKKRPKWLENKSIEYYNKSLNLWKDADPGIAEVEDTKKRLGGLKISNFLSF